MQVSDVKVPGIIIGVAIVIAALLFVFTPQSSSAGIKKQLTQEFNEAFVQDIEPTGEIIEYPITAEPATIQLASTTITNAWTYNGMSPGPEIRMTLGDTLRIPFTNNLPDETTIHFHGIRVPNAMDGVPGVTQEPIPSGGEFVYEFTPKDAGTFWFHPHVRGSEQLERGLYGTIIVEDEYSKSLDQDTVLILDDWRLRSENLIDENFNNIHDVSHDGRWGSITVNNKILEVVDVQPGERIRLRLVNTANARVFQPEFSQTVELVAVDGMSLAQPVPYVPIELSPGNRIDIEFIATETPIQIQDNFMGRTSPLATIQPSGDSVTTGAISYPTTIYLPKWRKGVVSMSPDLEYVLDAHGGGMMGSRAMSAAWDINGNLYGNDAPFSIKHDELVKVRFRNNSLRFHPMHLHGQFFKVVARDGKLVEEPYWRDTILVHGSETIDVIMMPRDKGNWALHCHIQEHAETGMMTTLTIS